MAAYYNHSMGTPAANVDSFYQACNRALGTQYPEISRRVINLEWLLEKAQWVYNDIHDPENGCPKLLSDKFISFFYSFPGGGKLAANVLLVKEVVRYLQNFKGKCDINCACPCTNNCNCVPQCSYDCGDCGPFGSNCGRCDCDCACVARCNCACGKTSECACDCDSFDCNCRVLSVNCTYNCECNCNCNCVCPCRCNCHCCFITTAVMQTFDKPDDCYELTMFRKFRDNWLKNQSDGKELIERYYKTAPVIVENIDKLENHKEIYLKIWNDFLRKCLILIEDHKFDECKIKYMEMVETLEEFYG